MRLAFSNRPLWRAAAGIAGAAVAMTIADAAGGAQAQSSAALMRKAGGGTEAAALLALARQKGFVRVIASFDPPAAPSSMPGDPAGIARITAQVAAAREAIVATHFGSGTTPRAGRGFARGLTGFPITAAFAVNVDAGELESLAGDARVRSIQPDGLSASGSAR